MKKDFEVISLSGARPFQEVYALQKELLQKRIDDQIPDTLIFCEHTPVITRGRGLQASVEPFGSERSKPLAQVPDGIDYFEIERGGDLTYHGLGQLVLYPIVKLGGEGRIGKAVGQDVNRWIRFLETIVVHSLSEFGIKGKTKPGGSGVWIPAKSGELDKKVASVGIALRRWVNYHGIAINIVNDLAPFFQFDPCGFKAEVMSRLVDLPEIERKCFDPDWRNHWEKRLLIAIESLT